MKTLDQIPPTWSQKLQCDATACPRFELVLDGAAVLDKETGLVWEKWPNTSGGTWFEVRSHCNTTWVGNRAGWRLPTVQELASLADLTQSNPALPAGSPFRYVLSDYYWTATLEGHNDSTAAWLVYFGNGGVTYGNKEYPGHKGWCVRGGQGVDVQ